MVGGTGVYIKRRSPRSGPLAAFMTSKNGQNSNPKGRPVKNTPEQVAEVVENGQAPTLELAEA